MKSICGRVLLAGLTLLVLLGAFLVVKTHSNVIAGGQQMTVTKVIPSMQGSDGAALSPDGSHVALVHTDWVGVSSGNSVLDVREVKTSKVVASYSMPYSGTGDRFDQGFNRLQYCEAGKYLLASDWHSKLYVLDTNTYQPHTVIDLNAIQLRSIPAGSASPAATVWSACAAKGNVLFLHLVGGRFNWGVTKLFNLDTGKEFEGFQEGVSSTGAGEAAISPAGLSAAYVGENSVVVIDLQTKRERVIEWKAEHPSELRIAFAGESAIALAEQVSPEKGKAMIHLFDIRSGSEIRTFGDPENGSFRYLGASADGRVVFGYSAKNGFCKNCNYMRGKYTISSPRFTVWDRASGKQTVQSPTLELLDHPCTLVRIIGSCEAFDEEPELQLSQDGNAVLATWQSGGKPVVVFNWR